uniref:DUF4150 domain-containing protein n=1 Tax=Strongyloides papillosus TaxID=174720 RepID=A0A0N5CCI6_STREA
MEETVIKESDKFVIFIIVDNNGARPGIQGENGGVYDYGAGNRGGTESGAGVGINQYGQGSGNFNGNTQGNGQGMNNNMGQNIGNENNQNNGGGTYPNGNQNVPPNRNPNQPRVSKFFSNPVVGSVLGIGNMITIAIFFQLTLSKILGAGIGGMYALNHNKMMMKQYAMMNGITKSLFLLVILGQNPYEMRIRNSMMKQQWKDDARRFRNENSKKLFNIYEIYKSF